METDGKKEADGLIKSLDPVFDKYKQKIKSGTVILSLERLKKNYQEALEFLEQARNYEKEWKDELAIDAYFKSGRLAENLRHDWERGIDDRRFNLERELEALEEFSKDLSPSSSDISTLFSEINNGLNGRMKELYESPERKSWEKKEAENRNKSFQQGYYLLQKDLNLDETSQVIDKLNGIDWLTVEYEEIYPLTLEQREKFNDLFTAQKLTLEKQVTTYLTQSLNLPQELIVSHDIDVCIRPYDYISDLRGISLDEIKDKKSVNIKLNFSGKTGTDIVNFGFYSLNGYDPDIVYITPYTLVNIKRAKKGHHLEIYNPQYKSWFGMGIAREPELTKRAAERTEEILNKLSH